MSKYYFEIYTFGSTLGIDNNATGTGADGFVASNGTANAQNDAWGSMQNGGWSVGPGGGAEFYLTSTAQKIGIWVTDDDAYLNDGMGDTGAVQSLLYPVTINGVTFAAGSRVELEYAVDTDAGGDAADYYVVRLGGNGLTETDGDTGYNVGILDTTSDALAKSTVYHVDNSIDGPSLAYASALCFANGTLIDTPDGPRAVEDLAVGDRVMTRDHGAQSLVWVGSTQVAAADLRANVALRPIAIAAGALGNRRALMVSPQHRMLISDWRAQLWYGEDDVLVAAKALVNGTTIRSVLPRGPLTWHHLMCQGHEILFAEGALAESFHPGASALELLSDQQMAELAALLPQTGGGQNAGSLAYPAVRSRWFPATRHAA